MKVGIHEAKTKLSKLIPAVLAGEEVIITKSGNPLVKLVPVRKTPGTRQLGPYKGKIQFGADFEKSLPDDVIEDFWSIGNDHGLSD